MEKVTGIGGFFFRAQDHKGLAEWYERHLGVSRVPTSAEGQPWKQEAGATAFSPFKADSSYFGDPAKQWMLNFRVNKLDAMVAQLTDARLIDSYQIVLIPVVLGAGRTMFDGISQRLSLALKGTRSFKNGNVVLDYEPA